MKRYALAPLAILLVLPACESTSDRFIARITTEHIGLREPQPPTPCGDLILAIRSDGTAFWSADRIAGGPPIHTASLDRKYLENCLREIERHVNLADPDLKRTRFGPDAGYTRITLTHAGRSLEMASWHELYEASGKVVGADHGLEALDGRDRDAVLAAQPASYRKFRKAWSDIRDRLHKLLPAESRLATEAELKTLEAQLRE